MIYKGGGGIKTIVVLASEPVGGRSRATELPCFFPISWRLGILGGHEHVSCKYTSCSHDQF